MAAVIVDKMTTPLRRFLKDMISQKAEHLTTTAEVVLVVDNASATIPQRKVTTTTSHSLKTSGRCQRKARRVANGSTEFSSSLFDAPQLREISCLTSVEGSLPSYSMPTVLEENEGFAF